MLSRLMGASFDVDCGGEDKDKDNDDDDDDDNINDIQNVNMKVQ